MYQPHQQQSPSQHSRFSLQLFSILNKLINNKNNQSPQQTLELIKQLQSQFNPILYSKYEIILFNFIKNLSILKQQQNQKQSQQQSNQKQAQSSTSNQSILLKFTQSFKAFLNIFSQTRTKIPQIQSIINNHKQIKLIVCQQKKLCSLKQEINNNKMYKINWLKGQGNNIKQKQKQKQKRHKTTNANNDKTNNITSMQQQNIKTNRIKKSNNLQQIYKAYIIYGKAINVDKLNNKSTQKQSSNPSISSQTTQSQPHNKQLSSQDIQQRQQITSNLQYCMSLMYQQQKLTYSKCQPNQIDDLLLTHDLPDNNSLLPILVTNQVYKYFVPLDSVLLLLIPEEVNNNNVNSNNVNNNNNTSNINNNIQPISSFSSIINFKQQSLPFLFKDTLLHVYLQNMRLLLKVVTRQSYYKNSLFKGIYFIQQGQVQTKSGRIVARGWVISGKCRSTTYVWRFHKVMTFFKYIVHNQNIWKQFVNDLKLNNQWPIQLSDVLSIDNTLYEQILGNTNNNYNNDNTNSSNKHYLSNNHNRNINNKKLKFPPISSGRLNRNFDINKLTEIQKMKHYDQKIHHLHQLKQQVLKKKIQHGQKKNSNDRYHHHSVSQAENKELNKRINILSQKMNLPQNKSLKTDVSRSLFLTSGQAPTTILIAGIVQKLKSIHQNSKQNDNNNGGSLQKSPREQSKLKLNKSRTKILGLKRYQDILKYQKNHLFKGKNYYQ